METSLTVRGLAEFIKCILTSSHLVNTLPNSLFQDVREHIFSIFMHGLSRIFYISVLRLVLIVVVCAKYLFKVFKSCFTMIKTTGFGELVYVFSKVIMYGLYNAI